jgi:glycosyltransferase involved in cell wall biosynthesis
MKQRPSCSLVVSTYNSPNALRRCLQSVLRQRVMPSEIIIADDGSGDETKKVIDEITAVATIPIIHVWQPDEGFQLARIRNKAILKSTSDYIINIDGDILLDKNFIHDHLYFARPGKFIAGDRASLSPVATQKYMEDRNGYPSFYTKSLKKRKHAFRCLWLAEFYCFIRRVTHPASYVMGCNMSFWRKDLLKVNGYNELFRGWGSEDCELAARLINIGIQARFVQCYAVVFHLYHPENDRTEAYSNNQLFREAIQNKIMYIEQGIDKHKFNQ